MGIYNHIPQYQMDTAVKDATEIFQIMQVRNGFAQDSNHHTEGSLHVGLSPYTQCQTNQYTHTLDW